MTKKSKDASDNKEEKVTEKVVEEKKSVDVKAKTVVIKGFEWSVDEDGNLLERL
jgi:hypothetical protein